MRRSEDRIKRQNEINKQYDRSINELRFGGDEAERVYNIAQNAPAILNDIDCEFEAKTGLDGKDATFLFIAIGLQIARQYLVSNEKFRLTSSQGDDFVENALLAPPEWKEVLLQSVPYDVINTGEHVNNTGLSGTTHRYRTLGHDPLLGWIFGTANIMTNALTKTNFETYQVNMNTKKIVRHYPLGVTGMMEKAFQYGTNDPMLFAASVARQAIHFGSDYFTKQGLPVPIIATVNNELAKKMLTEWHIDLYSIGRSAALSTFINTLIFFIHGLFFNGESEMDRKLYEVKTRKILSYSNLVASSSNVLVVGVTRDIRRLDVGGAAVTIYRLVTDKKFVRQVKEEFVFGKFNEMIRGDYSL